MERSLTTFLFVVLIIPFQPVHATDPTPKTPPSRSISVLTGGFTDAINKVLGQARQELLVQADSFTAPIAEVYRLSMPYRNNRHWECDADRDKAKSTAGELWKRKKRNTGIGLAKRQQVRTEVRMTIGNLLDQGLPGSIHRSCSSKKAAAVFQHVMPDMACGEVCMRRHEEAI